MDDWRAVIKSNPVYFSATAIGIVLCIASLFLPSDTAKVTIALTIALLGGIVLHLLFMLLNEMNKKH